jgi:hypothetical protein
MTEKDKKAKQRVDDEVDLRIKISKLLRDFSKKYDVELTHIDIRKNEFYPSTSGSQPPMYVMDLYWRFDYLGH